MQKAMQQAAAVAVAMAIPDSRPVDQSPTEVTSVPAEKLGKVRRLRKVCICSDVVNGVYCDGNQVRLYTTVCVFVCVGTQVVVP